MAIASDEDGSGRALLARVAGAGGRERAHLAAARHSRRVRFLRLALPALTAAILSLYLVSARVALPSLPGLDPGRPEVTLESLKMIGPRYEGFGKDGSRFLVTAREAQQDWQQKGPVRLAGITGRIAEKAGTTTDLAAERGTYDTKTGVLELLEAIDVRSASGMTAKLTQATVLTKEGRIVSRAPVSVGLPSGDVRGNAMQIDQKARTIAFTGGVLASLPPPARPAVSAPKAGAGRTVAGGLMSGRFASGSQEPIEVRAPELHVDDTSRVAVFKGGVDARQGQATLTTRELEVLYDRATTPAAAPAAEKASESAAAQQGRLKRIIARSDVVITQGSDRATSLRGEFDPEADTAHLLGKVEMTSGSDQKATAERADLFGRTDKAVLTGNVALTAGSDRRITADKAEIDTRTEATLLTGDVVVTQARNILRGRRLAIDRQAGTLQLTTPSGRISARFQQSDGEGGQRKPAAPKPEASAAGGFMFRTDANAPIDLEADTLDASDQSRTATFRGDVRAVQGDFTIRTAEMVAHYTGQAAPGSGAKEAKGGGRGAGVQLQRIRAARKVLATSARDDQNATGDWGEFDVKGNTFTIGGNVTMTQGQQIVRGEKLVIDTTTGQARIYGAERPGESVAGGEGGRAPGARPSAVFYPNQIRELAKKRAVGAIEARPEQQPPPSQPKRPPAAASSWDANVNGAPAPDAGKSPN
jgi:lipopolysaccharide transport protein LptA